MEKQDSHIRFCLYARKSSESDERQAISIDSQVNEMQKIAQRDNLEIGEIYRESHTAKKCGQRETFNKLLKEIEQGIYSGIITWSPDRRYYFISLLLAGLNQIKINENLSLFLKNILS